MARKAKGAWWTSFRVDLSKAMAKLEEPNETQVYIAQFTRASQLKPAVYAFGEQRVTL